MGTIVANDLIHRNPDMLFSDIVYMGAACTIKEFASTALPYLKESAIARFYNLSLHPFEEIDDRYGAEVLPHGSLLEWIDSYITEHESPLDRTLGKWDNIASSASVMSYLPAPTRMRLLFRGFPRSPDQGSPAFPQDHGDFNDLRFEYWKPSFWDFRCDPKTAARWFPSPQP